MKEKIIGLVDSITVKKAIIATVLFLIMLYLIDFSPIGVTGMLKVSNGVGILDFETRYSAEYAYNWLESMGEAGRNFHLTRVMPLDILFPPCFMMLMSSWLCLLVQKVTGKSSLLRCLPCLGFLYMLLDWSENVGITAMLMNYPLQLARVAVTTGWITSVKKTVILLILIAYACCILALLVQAIRKRLQK